jgi:hypothetical protein
MKLAFDKAWRFSANGTQVISVAPGETVDVPEALAQVALGQKLAREVKPAKATETK